MAIIRRSYVRKRMHGLSRAGFNAAGLHGRTVEWMKYELNG